MDLLDVIILLKMPFIFQPQKLFLHIPETAPTAPFNCALIGKENLTAPVLLISSPEHMCRALKSFQKQGFVSIGTAPAFDSPLSETQIKNKSKAGKKQVKNSDLRYNLWSYLHYELLVLREYCALAYYKVQGWI